MGQTKGLNLGGYFKKVDIFCFNGNRLAFVLPALDAKGCGSQSFVILLPCIGEEKAA